MPLSDHSLRQIDEVDLRSLELAALCALSVRLLADRKEARERLNQGPTNSSRSPSSRVPWDRGEGAAEADEAEADPCEPAPADEPPTEPETPRATAAAGVKQPKRQPGKRPGAPGVGRTQVFPADQEQAHYPGGCAGGGRALDPAGAVVYSGFQAVDLG